MNSELKKRAVAIIDGQSSTTSERLDLLLGITLDIYDTVGDHETRIVGLEVYPKTVSRLIGAALGLAALTGAVIGLAQLVK